MSSSTKMVNVKFECKEIEKLEVERRGHRSLWVFMNDGDIVLSGDKRRR